MAKLSGTFKRAKAIYSKMESSLLPEHKGEIIAIEPISGDYIIGPDEVEVALEGKNRHPGKKFGFFRIGMPVMYKLRRKRDNAERKNNN